MPKSFLYPGSLGEEPKSFLYPGSLGEDAPNLSRGSGECPTYQEVVGNVFLCDFVFSTFLDMCYNLHASHAAPCPGQQHIMQSCPTYQMCVCDFVFFNFLDLCYKPCPGQQQSMQSFSPHAVRGGSKLLLQTCVCVFVFLLLLVTFLDILALLFQSVCHSLLCD